jgi:hypothetical protein
MRRATTFAAALAVNQGAPHVALEIIGTTRNQNYITVRNIKVCKVDIIVIHNLNKLKASENKVCALRDLLFLYVLGM